MRRGAAGARRAAPGPQGRDRPVLRRDRAAAQEARLAAEHARRAGDGGLRGKALAWYLATMLYGPMPALEVAATLSEVRQESSGPYLEGMAEWIAGELALCDGSPDEARERVLAAAERYGSLGIMAMTGGCHMTLAEIELAVDDPPRACAWLERGDTLLAEIGERQFRSTVQAYLARARERAGDAEAAQATITLAEELGAPDDLINFVITHHVRARLALREGNLEEAERWGRSAVEHAERTDFWRQRAQAKLTLSAVLWQRGLEAESVAEAREALAITEAKGSVPDAAQARSILAQLAA